MSEPCPVCKTISEIRGADFGGTILFHIICPRCGEYQIEYVAKSYLNIQLEPTKVAVLSHAIRKMQRNTEIPLLDQMTVALILQNPLPRPADQMNNFVIWLGDNTPGLGEKVNIDWLVMQAEIGVRTQEGVNAIVGHLVEKNLVEKTGTTSMSGGPGTLKLTLKLEGWEYYENLKRGNILKSKGLYGYAIWGKRTGRTRHKIFSTCRKSCRV